ESLERQARSGLDLIIEAAGKAEARALIAIFAEIDCRLHRNRSAAEVNRAGLRLDVVDAAAVPVVAAADEHAELMMRAEARGASGAQLRLAAAADDVRVAAFRAHRVVRPIAGRLGAEIDRAANRVAVLAGGQRLRHFDRSHQIRGNDIELD